MGTGMHCIIEGAVRFADVNVHAVHLASSRYIWSVRRQAVHVLARSAGRSSGEAQSAWPIYDDWQKKVKLAAW